MRSLPSTFRTFVWVFALALAFAPSALAQAIGDDHDVFLDAVGAVANGDAYLVGPLELRTEAPGNVLANVTVEGLLDAAGIEAAASTFAIATGYGEGIREPLATFLTERAQGYIGQGPVAVGVEGYQLELDVTTGVAIGTPVASLTMSIPRAPDEAFGLPASTIGDPDAPVLIRVFSDFECPYCKRYAEQILPMLEQSVLETEGVAFAFHHFPLNTIHANAEPAAVASQCVQDLYGVDAFWPYHDLIFERQGAWGSLGDPDPYFLRLLGDTPEVVTAAGSADAAEEQVAACIAQGDALAFVREATDRAIALGVQGTPTVFVGGHRVSDFGTPDAYLRLIRLERALAGLADASPQ